MQKNNYMKVEYLKKVAEFHKLMKQPILNSPQLPSKDRQELRVSLIQEELDEFAEALKSGDIVEALDALCDMQYVLSGSILELGMQDIFDEAFDEVHRSNMSKACNTVDEAVNTQKYYSEKGVDTYYVERDSKYFVLRKEDDKQLKSINYSPAALKQFLEAKRS